MGSDKKFDLKGDHHILIRYDQNIKKFVAETNTGNSYLYIICCKCSFPIYNDLIYVLKLSKHCIEINYEKENVVEILNEKIENEVIVNKNKNEEKNKKNSKEKKEIIKDINEDKDINKNNNENIKINTNPKEDNNKYIININKDDENEIKPQKVNNYYRFEELRKIDLKKRKNILQLLQFTKSS